ncbi:MAG: hypothetical protein Q8830_02780 [Candidatus Phytoplasma australasiaticum]|nr:hypothetical protein [Candidatus Phytoplasma australasiaticum]
MKEGVLVENMFAHLSKIIGELKATSKEYPPIEHIRRILRSLPPYWHVKVVALEIMDVKTLIYNEVRGDRVAFEKPRLNKKGKDDDKKKSITFKATDENHDDEEDLNKDEIVLITK